MIFLFIWAVACLILDRWMTGYAIQKYGAREINVVAAWMIEKMGFIPATIAGGVIYLGVVLYMTEVKLVAPLVVLLAGYTAVCAQNAILLYRAANRRKR